MFVGELFLCNGRIMASVTYLLPVLFGNWNRQNAITVLRLRSFSKFNCFLYQTLVSESTDCNFFLFDNEIRLSSDFSLAFQLNYYF